MLMEDLFGSLNTTPSSLSNLMTAWEVSDFRDFKYSFRTAMEFDSFQMFDPTIEKYAGMTNGRLFARHEKKYHLSRSRTVNLYDHKFNEVASYFIDENCTDIFIGLSSDDTLRVLTSNGYLYTFFGNRFLSKIHIYERIEENTMVETYDAATKSNIMVPIDLPFLIPSVKNNDTTIKDAIFWDTGCLFIDSTMTMFYVQNFSKVTYFNHFTKLPYLQHFRVIPPNYTADNSPIVMASDGSEFLHISTDKSVFSIKLDSKILIFEISPNFEYIVFLLEPQRLVISTIDLKKRLQDFEMDEEATLFQIAWIGDKWPVFSFQDQIVLPDTDFGSIILSVDGKPVLFSANNSCYVLDSKGLKILNIISTNLFNISLA